MSPEIDIPLLIQPFQWQDWNGLWQLRKHQLAEQGITIDTLPTEPDLTSPYEEDYHRIDQVYLTTRGNFWIAWMDGLPVGNIGAEDKGAYIEQREVRMRLAFVDLSTQ